MELIDPFQEETFVHESNSLRSRFRINREELEKLESKEFSPWVNHYNHFNLRQPMEKVEKSCSLDQKSRIINFRTKTELRKKRGIQETHEAFKLNNTLVQFNVRMPLENQSKNKLESVESNQLCKKRSIWSTLTKKRAESSMKQKRGEESIEKTPKIKFLEQKFRIKYKQSQSSKINQFEDQQQQKTIIKKSKDHNLVVKNPELLNRNNLSFRMNRPIISGAQLGRQGKVTQRKFESKSWFE